MMKRFSHPATALFLALGVLVFSGNPGPSSAATWSPAPIPSRTRVWVGPCVSSTDLDCVESVGAVINGQEVKGTLTGRTGPSADGGISSYEWRIQGLVNEDGKDLVSSQVLLTGANTERTNLYPSTLVGLSVSVYATNSDGFRPQWESGLDTCDAVNGRMNGKCVRYGNLQSGIKFSVIVRTSWTMPSLVSSKNGETTTAVEKLATSGASRVTVAGIPHRTLGVDPPQVNSVDSSTSRGAWANRLFGFDVLDGRQFGSLASCYEQPTLVVSDNAWGPSVPTFDRSTGALDLKVRNPHFDVDGTTLFTGAYQARIPQETAQCLWGPKIASTKQFKVSVIEDSTGSSKVSTTSVTSDGTTFRIDASGFTFSSPTIRVTADESLGTTTTTINKTPVPSKPTGVSTVAARGSVTVTFSSVSGVSHTVTATYGSLRKTFSCRVGTSKVTCSAKSMKKGTWKLSIVPRNSSGAGTAYTKSVRVS